MKKLTARIGCVALALSAAGCFSPAAMTPERKAPMQQRMKNPAMVIPEAMPAIQGLNAAAESGGVPAATMRLVHLRVSQINGCAACIDGGERHARQAGESEVRLAALPRWHEATCFTPPERAALGLAEAETRMSDRSDPVSDEVWAEVVKHYDERAAAALILWIATTNVFNRLNVTVRQGPGQW